MRDIILMAAIIAMFCYGYLLMGKIGLFIRDNQRISTLGDRPEGCNIIIATQKGDNITDIRQVFNAYRKNHRGVTFTYKNCGDKSVEKLKKGAVDIVASQNGALCRDRDCTAVCLDGGIWLMYGRGTAPRVKGVVTEIQNGGYSLKTGYRDY